jgi:hypothetical protein
MTVDVTLLYLPRPRRGKELPRRWSVVNKCKTKCETLELMETYGIETGVARYDNGKKYCKHCEKRFTKNTEQLLTCPCCRVALRKGARDKRAMIKHNARMTERKPRRGQAIKTEIQNSYHS